MLRARRQNTGNTLVLVVVSIVVLGLVIAFFALNYGSLLGTHSEAQNAVEAAALEAARQISMDPNVPVSTSLGLIGVVDLAPNSPGNSQPIPVVGINTAIATARLDSLIAQDLGNSTMLVLAQRDLQAANAAANQLLANINKEMPTISTTVQNTYQENNRRMGQGTLVPGSLTIEVCQLNAAAKATTNIQVPNGSDPGASGNTTNNYYNAYVNIPAGPVNAVFSALGQQPRLVDKSQYAPLASGVPPTVVRVSADNNVVQPAPNSEGQTQTLRIHNEAMAMAGGSLVTQPSTTYCVSFRAGFPPGSSFDSVVNMMNAAQLTAGGSSEGNGPWGPIPSRTWYQAPKGGAIPPGPPSPANFPDGSTNGTAQSNPSVALSFGLYDWLRSLGLRPSRTAVASALSANLRTYVGSNTSTPAPINFSENWGFAQPVYAQSSSSTTIPQSSCWLAFDPSNPDGDPRQQGFTSMQPGSAGSQMVTNSFNYELAASTCPANSVATAVDSTGTPKTTSGENISILQDFENALIATNHASNVAFQAGNAENKYQTGIQQAQQAVADQAAANRDAANTKASQDQSLITQDKAAISSSTSSALTTQLQAAITQSQSDMAQQLQNAQQYEAQRAAAQALADAAQNIASRAARVAQNGQQVLDKTFNYQHLQLNAITSNGIHELSSVNFSLGTQNPTTFNAYPNAAGQYCLADNLVSTLVNTMQQQIRNTQSVLSTGQGAAVWDATSALAMCGGQNVIVAQARSKRAPDDWFALPQRALAAGAQPPNLNLMFLFNVSGNAQANAGGTITLTALPMSPFINQSTVSQQVHYIAVGALTTGGMGSTGYNGSANPIADILSPPAYAQSGGATVTWTVQARDEQGNLTAQTSQNATGSPSGWCNGGSGYGMSLSGSCPTLSGEWQIGCPVPGGCSYGAGTTVVNSSGATEVKCPPPPPVMG